jgi:hypothetical protein
MINNTSDKMRLKIMKSFLKKLKGRTGQSMAEFAVTTAMMATLATTAAPKFSGVGEGAKGKKTEAEIDKVMKAASNFYSAKVTSEGRGRFPGQEKYNEPVGGYTSPTSNQSATGGVAVVDSVLEGSNAWRYNSTTGQAAYLYTQHGVNWRSVFGWTNTTGGQSHPDVVGGPSDDDTGTATIIPGQETCCVGKKEWLQEFGKQPIKSPFQDGHYIYVVVPGGGAGNLATSPVIYIADLESPADYYKKYQP